MEQESDSDSDDSEASDDEVELESSLYIAPTTEDIIQACYECTSSFLLPEVPFGVDVEEEYSHLPFSSENHVSQLGSGELLVGGMPRRKTQRLKGRNRTRNPRIGRSVPNSYGSTFTQRKKVPFFFDYRFELSGGPVAEFNIRVNDMYNILAAGTPTVFYPGRSEYALIYSFARLLRVEMEWSFVNESADNSYELVASFSNTALGSPTETKFLTYASRKWSKTRLLSVRGGMDRTTFMTKASAVAIAGDPSARSDDSYLSGFASSPTNFLFGGVMIRSMNGANCSECFARLRLKPIFLLSHLRVEAGDPSPLPTPSLSPLPPPSDVRRSGYPPTDRKSVV